MSKRLKLILCIALLSHISVAAAPTKLAIPIRPVMFSDTGHAPHAEDFSNPALRSIGRLHVLNSTTNESESCAATLVAPDIIVTAAHCFLDKNGFFNNADLEFITGAETRNAGTARAVISFKTKGMTLDPLEHPGLDIAFMRLKKRLDPKVFPPAEISSANEVFKTEKVAHVFLTAYDRLLGPSTDKRPTTEACELIGFFQGSHEITHNCSTRVGMSGAPVYVILDGKVIIIGIHDGGLAASCNFNTDNPIPFTPACANRASGGDLVAAGLAKYKSGTLEPDTVEEPKGDLHK